MWQDFKDESFVTLGVDVWNGTPTQVSANFRGKVKTSFPLLLNGSSVARTYGLGYEDYLVIDHQGIIRYRPAAFGVSLKAVRSTIEETLSKLPEPEAAPEAKEAVEELSWGRIKADAE